MASQRKYLLILICLLILSLVGNILAYAGSGGKQPAAATPLVPLPDLKPTNLYLNEDCDLMVEIANEGPGDFSGEVGYLVETSEIPPGNAFGAFNLELASGETKTILLLYEAQIRFIDHGQNHEVTFWINPPAENFSLVYGFPHIVEASEANNRLTLAVTCGGEDLYTIQTIGGTPDLVPELIFREIPKAPPTNGSPYTRLWEGILLVTNQGTGTAGEFRVTGDQFGYSDWEHSDVARSFPLDVTFAGLRPGRHVSYQLWPLYWGPGGTQVGWQVTVDPDAAVAESNEDNNVTERWFPELNLPKWEVPMQLTMIGKITPDIFVFCPDIIISIYHTRCSCERTPIKVWHPSGIVPGWWEITGYKTECEVKVDYVVKNIGTQDAGVFHVKLDSSTGHTGKDYISGLLVGEEKYRHWIFTTDSAGSVTVTVTADIDDELIECDEDNNTDTTSFRCWAANRTGNN